MRRREFIHSLAATAGLGAASAAGQTAPSTDTTRRWKGRANSKIKRWDVPLASLGLPDGPDISWP